MNIMTNKTVGKLSFDSRQPIGRGRYGIVFKGYNMTGAEKMKPVAIKRIERGPVDDSTIKQEVKNMLEAGDHPNILSFILIQR